METYRLKRILPYLAAAIVLGVLAVLVPSVTIAALKAEDRSVPAPESIFGGFERFERAYSFRTTEDSSGDVKIFAFSFAVALVVYVIIKHRRPERVYRVVWRCPY
jgi:hypothetical protein